VLFLTAQIEKDIAIALGIGCIFVASVGWIDDHQHIPANWRALFYGIAAVLAVYFLAESDSFQSVFHYQSFGIVSSCLIVIWIVWMTNLYNFMDGTDALAAIQTICTSLLVGVIFLSNCAVNKSTAIQIKTGITIERPPPMGVGIKWELRSLGTSINECFSAYF